jgi:type IV pilus assembly protein PilB
MAVKKIGELLKESGLISDAQLKEALKESKQSKDKRFGDILVDGGFCAEIDIAQTLSFQLKIPFVDISKATVEPEAVKLLSEKIAKKHLLIPLHLDGRVLNIAMVDPLDLAAIDDIRFLLSLEVKPHVATLSDVNTAIKRHYHLSDPMENLMIDLDKDRLVEVLYQPESKRDLAEQVRKSSAPPIIKMVDSIILHGVDKLASDIHIEPQENEVKLRLRIDGIMSEAMQLPKWVQGPVVSRIKVMSKMDIAERRLSQDGRLKVRVGERSLDIRVSTLPTHYGETVVMRLLDPGASMIGLGSMGFTRRDLERVEDMIKRPQGVVLVTGPTGAGKTSTLYAMVTHIKSEAINIITIEDPIEYELKGVNQVAVNEKTGLTFSYTLRSILRQDPDVIFVGEMRDEETALIAHQASLTGHMVFSTLHTNDAVSAVTRLRNLGVPPYMVASALNGIVAQRLVRKICTRCKKPYTPDDDELQSSGIKLDGEKVLYRGTGCDDCGSTGYSGRIGIFEVMGVNARIKELIVNDAPEREIAMAAEEAGMIPMHMDGLAKVVEGLTTLEELTRVIYLSGGPGEPGGLQCPWCLKPRGPDSELCSHCGHYISVKCAGCAKARKPGWVLCPFCAHRFEEDEPVQEAPGPGEHR